MKNQKDYSVSAVISRYCNHEVSINDIEIKFQLTEAAEKFSTISQIRDKVKQEYKYSPGYGSKHTGDIASGTKVNISELVGRIIELKLVDNDGILNRWKFDEYLSHISYLDVTVTGNKSSYSGSTYSLNKTTKMVETFKNIILTYMKLENSISIKISDKNKVFALVCNDGIFISSNGSMSFYDNLHTNTHITSVHRCYSAEEIKKQADAEKVNKIKKQFALSRSIAITLNKIGSVAEPLYDILYDTIKETSLVYNGGGVLIKIELRLNLYKATIKINKTNIYKLKQCQMLFKSIDADFFSTVVASMFELVPPKIKK